MPVGGPSGEWQVVILIKPPPPPPPPPSPNNPPLPPRRAHGVLWTHAPLASPLDRNSGRNGSLLYLHTTHQVCRPEREYYTRCAHGAHAVRVLGRFHRPTHLSDSDVHVFPSCKGHSHCTTALCPLKVSPMSLSWLPAGITVTYNDQMVTGCLPSPSPPPSVGSAWHRVPKDPRNDLSP